MISVDRQIGMSACDAHHQIVVGEIDPLDMGAVALFAEQTFLGMPRISRARTVSRGTSMNTARSSSGRTRHHGAIDSSR